MFQTCVGASEGDFFTDPGTVSDAQFNALRTATPYTYQPTALDSVDTHTTYKVTWGRTHAGARTGSAPSWRSPSENRRITNALMFSELRVPFRSATLSLLRTITPAPPSAFEVTFHSSRQNAPTVPPSDVLLVVLPDLYTTTSGNNNC